MKIGVKIMNKYITESYNWYALYACIVSINELTLSDSLIYMKINPKRRSRKNDKKRIKNKINTNK